MKKIVIPKISEREKGKLVEIAILSSAIWQFLLILLIFRLDSVVSVLKFGFCIILLGFLQLLMFNGIKIGMGKGDLNKKSENPN